MFFEKQKSEIYLSKEPCWKDKLTEFINEQEERSISLESGSWKIETFVFFIIREFSHNQTFGNHLYATFRILNGFDYCIGDKEGRIGFLYLIFFCHINSQSAEYFSKQTRPGHTGPVHTGPVHTVKEEEEDIDGFDIKLFELQLFYTFLQLRDGLFYTFLQLRDGLRLGLCALLMIPLSFLVAVVCAIKQLACSSSEILTSTPR